MPDASGSLIIPWPTVALTHAAYVNDSWGDDNLPESIFKRRGEKMPRILYLQLDNTTKQNKGRYLAAWAAPLVAEGVLELQAMDIGVPNSKTTKPRIMTSHTHI